MKWMLCLKQDRMPKWVRLIQYNSVVAPLFFKTSMEGCEAIVLANWILFSLGDMWF